MAPSGKRFINGFIREPATRRLAQPAFTLIEMVIVVGIVLLILGLVLPASIDIWNARKISDAENIIRGLLMTSRARALRTDAAETGLFFYLNEEGGQRITTIERDSEHSGDPTWQDVFRVTNERTYALPAPIRVVPRYVVEPDDAAQPFTTFSADELANNSFENPITGGSFNQSQRHRNFFTMIYARDGQLLRRRDVIVRDDDLENVAGSNRRGSVTGLQVGRGGDGSADVVRYYRQDDSQADIDPTGRSGAVDFAIIEPQAGGSSAGTAMNFPSVDGLLVYDDADFNNAADLADDKRAFLLEGARPFYVNRYTGEIIRGPRNE